MESYLLGLLIIGAPAFGLEALLIGLGGKLALSFDSKLELLKFILPTGLIIVGVSIWVYFLLSLEPIYLVALTLALTFCAGEITSLIKTEALEEKDLPEEQEMSEEDVKSMLKDRGLDHLLKEKENENQ